MRRKVPSTSALLTFEAAGRHESFSRAAEELAMTEGAVSRQVARLEEYLGVRVFDRVKGRIRLTQAGRLYWTQVVGNLDRIERDTLTLLAQPTSGGILELAVIPTFTNRWVLPRLPRFYERSTGIVVNMSERPEPFVFSESRFDAAIHYDHPAWAGMAKEDLFAEELVPICSPDLIRGQDGVDLARLRTLPLLHKRGRNEAWQRWWDRVGVHHGNPMEGARYDLFSMVIEAAIAGLGLALVPRLYVAREIEGGRLVVPFDGPVASEKRYCLIYPAENRRSWPLGPFIDWLKSEADAFAGSRGIASAARLHFDTDVF